MKKGRPLWVKALAGLCALLLAVVGVVVGCGVWFATQLDETLALSEEDAQAIEAVAAPCKLDEPFYLLLLGSDSREGTVLKGYQNADGSYSQRADVMMLVYVDAPRHQITMVSIPRDTRYVYPEGTVAKINDAYNYGAASSVQAVATLTGTPISYYAAVDFANFEAIIDALGGITVHVPADIKYKDALTGEMLYLEEGTQKLDGQHAQLLARARKEYGEDVRQDNNRQMIEAMVKAVVDRPVKEIPDTIIEVASHVDTNFTAGDLLKLGLAFASGEGKLTFYSCTGPTDGDFDSAYGGTWYCYDNPVGWAKLISVVDAGLDPSGVEVNDTAIIHS